MKEALKEFEEALLQCWEVVRQEVTSLYEALTGEEEEEKPYIHDYNWQVPKNTCREHQVMNRRPVFINVRNQL